MAILQLENGKTYTDLNDISRELSALKVELNPWPIGEDAEVRKLLEKDVLSDEEKERILQSLDRYFEELKTKAGYKTRDLIAIHPAFPNLDAMLSKFDKCHTHADDEVRYIVAGEGIFGFVRPDGSQVELTVEAEEYIKVPANSEHWFYLTPQKRIFRWIF